MVEDTIIQAVTIIQLIIQYLLQPRNFLLTFVLPVAFCFINRRFIWLSVLITIVVELVVNWGNFTYYEECPNSQITAFQPFRALSSGGFSHKPALVPFPSRPVFSCCGSGRGSENRCAKPTFQTHENMINYIHAKRNPRRCPHERTGI